VSIVLSCIFHRSSKFAINFMNILNSGIVCTFVLVLRSLKALKNQSSSAHLSKLETVKGEIVVELEGTVTTQPVLQHIGVSTWPGNVRLMLYNLCSYHCGYISNLSCCVLSKNHQSYSERIKDINQKIYIHCSQ
jgi:hypothetical protein